MDNASDINYNIAQPYCWVEGRGDRHMEREREEARPSPAPETGVQVLEEPRVGAGGKTCAVGGGVIAAVC